MLKNIRLLISSLLLWILSTNIASSQPPLLPVKTDSAMSYIQHLSDPDLFQGRKSGQKGEKKAMKYIAEKFDDWNLKPLINDNFLVPFEMIASTEKAGKMSMPNSEWGVVNFLLGDDFTVCGNSGSAMAYAPVVLVGHGISKPDKNWDDYGDMDVKDKIVVIFRGTPATGEYWHAELSRNYTYPEACKRGAKAVLYYQDSFPIGGATIMEKAYNPDVPALYIGERILRHILFGTGYSVDGYKRKLKENPLPLETNRVLRIETKVSKIRNGMGYNVVGVVPGTDPILSKEAIIVGGHGDHAGSNAAGQVYSGADDNASGTGSVMELARVFAANPQARTLIFCIFGAEEQGLLGSTALVPLLPDTYSYINMLNFDMTGRGEGKFGMGGADQLPEVWEPFWESIPAEVKEYYEPNRAWGGESSDHAPFRKAGIPAFTCYSRGKHDFYHSLDDQFYNIEGKAIEGTIKGAARWIEAIASFEQPLRDKNIRERTIWHHGLPVILHQNTGEPVLDMDLAERQLKDGFVGLILSIPYLPDSVRFEQTLTILDRWQDRIEQNPKTNLATKLSDMRGNSYRRKASIFISIEADSLQQSDSTLIEAAHAMGLSWAVLRDHGQWVLDGGVRADKTPVLRELTEEGGLLQLPFNEPEQWLPVAEKYPGKTIMTGTWSDFNQVTQFLLDKLHETGTHFLVLAESEDLNAIISATEKIKEYKIHIQPPEQDYYSTLSWVGYLMDNGVERETILEWLGGNLKLWK